MSLAFGHDNDISDCYVGRKLYQGEVFCQNGNYGNVTGIHSHVTVIRGKYTDNPGWIKVSTGNYTFNNAIHPCEALFISDHTNVIDTKGLSFKKSVISHTSIPTVFVSSFGLHADVSWNDVGASSYYVYIQNQLSGDIPYGENIGKQCSAHFMLAEGNYKVFVTASYSESLTATGSASFRTEKLRASVDRGMDGIYNVNDSVTMSLNTSNFDTCSLSIYRTPNGGETYKYWEYPISTSSYTLTFPHDGYYSCCFTVKKGSYTIESEWVGWSVVAPSYTISYDANGGKNAPSSQLKKKSVDLQITSEFPICSGYAFLGWATVKNSKTPEYQPGDIYIENADATLYAVWLKPDLILPDALMDIEEEAFAGGTFQFVWLSDSVRSISSRAFADCPNLKHIRIPHQMTLATLMRLVRTEDAFEGCEGITVHGEDNPYSKAFATRYGFNYIADE